MARILFIDDDTITLNMLRKVMKMTGHEAITSFRGIDAVAMAEQEQPDLILLDMHMPDMDGLEILKALKARESTAKIPALILSASSTIDETERVIQAGGRGFLQKPLSMEKLLEVIYEYTGERSVS